MFANNNFVSELRRNMTYVSISTILFTDNNYFYCVIFVFIESVKLRIHLLFKSNFIEFQLQMSGNYFLMLSNPNDRITYLLDYCCQTVKYFECSVLLTKMIYCLLTS